MGTIKANAIVGQSGGPTAAINATLCGVIRGMLNHAPGHRLFGMRNGIEGCLEERMVDLTDLFTLEDGRTPDENALKLRNLPQRPDLPLTKPRTSLKPTDAAFPQQSTVKKSWSDVPTGCVNRILKSLMPTPLNPTA